MFISKKFNVPFFSHNYASYLFYDSCLLIFHIKLINLISYSVIFFIIYLININYNEIFINYYEKYFLNGLIFNF